MNEKDKGIFDFLFYDYYALSEKIVSCLSWKVYIYNLYCIPWSVRSLDSCHQRTFSSRRLPFFHWVISYFLFHILEAASSCSTAMHPSCLTSRCPREVWEKRAKDLGAEARRVSVGDVTARGRVQDWPSRKQLRITLQINITVYNARESYILF